MWNIVNDLKLAVRNLRKSPGFVSVAIITLALGIGVNAAIFSVVDFVLFRDLPYDNADRIVALYRPYDAGGKLQIRRWSYPHYEDYRGRVTHLRHMVAWTTTALVVGRGEATDMRVGELVSGNYFQALGAQPALGRLFTPEDNVTPRAHPATVLGYNYWKRVRGGDPDIVGTTIAINNHDFTVIGVANESFSGMLPFMEPTLWLPMMMEPIIEPNSTSLENRGAIWMDAFGVLEPESTLAEANAELALIAGQLRDSGEPLDEREMARAYPMQGVMVDPSDRTVGFAMAALVMSMVGVILLIACANIANLLLARATTRRKEVGIRLALGSSRLRLARQLLVESLLIAVTGGLIGMLVASWAMRAVPLFLPDVPVNATFTLDFGLNRNVLLFGLGVSILTGVVFGLVPAVQAARADLLPALRDDGAGSTQFKRSRLRSGLVVAQVAASLVLLIVSGLFVRSLANARAIDPGFEHERTLAVMMELDRYGYEETGGRAFCRDLLAGVRELPGVESAALDRCVPLGFNSSTNSYYLEGDERTMDDGTPFHEQVRVNVISEGDAETLGIPLLRGRDFNDTDLADSTPVAIVNQAFAEQNWPGENPLGKRISFRGADGPFMEIVGVVATVKYDTIGEKPTPVVHTPLSQTWSPRLTLLVKTTGDPDAMLPAVRDVMTRLDPDFVPADARTLTNMIGFALLPAKVGAGLFSLFGILALLLATVGLYGVMSYMVSQRTHEIGIRMAIGANRGDVLRLVMRQGLVLTMIGLAIGLVAAFGFTRVLRVLLYDVSPSDPVTFAGIAFLLVAVAALATLIPARRAMRVDPMLALRYE